MGKHPTDHLTEDERRLRRASFLLLEADLSTAQLAVVRRAMLCLVGHPAGGVAR